jgi:mono/diheme cytochrome c family protein
MAPIRFSNLFAIAAITFLAAAGSPCSAFAQQKLGAPPGKGSYVRFCSGCHGVDGKGNGPEASKLKEKPADLTQLAKKNNNTFPTARVTRILNGSEVIPAHGSRQTPVWGHEFGAGERTAGGHVSPTVARERIQLIIRYLESIQEK